MYHRAMTARALSFKTIASFILAVAGFLVCATATAQQASAERDRMTRSMEDYFEGERSAGAVFLGEGLVSMGTSAFLFTRHDEMSRGAAYPVAIIGTLEAVVGLGLTIRTSKQVAERKAQIALAPAKFQQDERKRMQRVIRQFVFLEVFELASMATGIGLVTAGELNQKPFMTGIGAGLAVQGAAVLGLDFLAERRGRRYLKAIVDFQPAVAKDGFGLTMRGVF
jgi:hypothetical protein